MSKVHCKNCKLLFKIFRNIKNNYEYWLMTEVFVYLHAGKDYCNYETNTKNR